MLTYISMFKFCGALLLMLAMPTSLLASPIYVIKEKDGTTRFTTTPPKPGVEAKVFTAKKSSFSWYRVSSRGYRRGSRLFKVEFKDFIETSAKKHGLPQGLIRAVVHVESAFNPKAVSPKGAMGLMQLMPDTAKLVGVKRPFDPAENIAGGTKHLARLYQKFKGNLKLTLAAYNAGEQAVANYQGIPPFSETQNYVREVTRLFALYAKS